MWYPCKNSWHSYRVCTEGPIRPVYPDTVEPTKVQISSKGPPWDTKERNSLERSNLKMAIPTGNHHRGWKIPGNSMVFYWENTANSFGVVPLPCYGKVIHWGCPSDQKMLGGWATHPKIIGKSIGIIIIIIIIPVIGLNIKLLVKPARSHDVCF